MIHINKKLFLFILLFSFSLEAYELKTFSKNQWEKIQTEKKSGTFYLWSPTMPLSVQGAEELLQLQKDGLLKDNYEVIPVLDPNVGEDLIAPAISNSPLLKSQDVLYVASTNYIAGLHLDNHFPSLQGFVEGKSTITVKGYKTPNIVKRYLDNLEFNSGPPHLFQPTTFPTKNATLINSGELPHRGVGAFFKTILGTEWIFYNYMRKNYLYNLHSKQLINAPGRIDPVPSPDGLLLTVTGLDFYSIEDLMSGKNDISPILRDEEMIGQYQTIGLLESNENFRKYRVLTGWGKISEVKDYSVTVEDNKFLIEPGEEVASFCELTDFSLPMISRNGRMMAIMDRTLRSTVILELNDEGKCSKIIANLGISTGKASFSPDNKWVVFARIMRRNIENQIEFYREVLVYSLEENQIYQLPNVITHNTLSFPDFITNDSIIFLSHDRDDESKKDVFYIYKLTDL